ncbi:MAG TPA: hypothetical protein VHV75_12210 [Solirubrobacteraceae bacterium]|jgi:hypothetical protein|nr:hypothetical protein [Solirubrobacteraceae bacterium]
MNNSEGDRDEFLTLQTAGPAHRVIGYQQSFATGTSVAAAKTDVRALLPKDTKTTAYLVQHDSTGATCVFWDVRSATLGRWLGSPKIGDSKGVIGIELSTADANGNIVYTPADVEAASVGIAAVDHSINC